MDDNHLLKLNPSRVLSCLQGVLTTAELAKVRAEHESNVAQLIRLAEAHLRFAKNAAGQLRWRQRVSRGYYCCYTLSRAIRLSVFGHYNTESGDHKKIGNLPSDFPQGDIWSDLLTKFRADRNLADYDHTVTEASLELASSKYVEKASQFLATTKSYLAQRRTP